MPRAMQSLLASTVLGSMLALCGLTGCASRPAPPPSVVIVATQPCPAPVRPVLPMLDGTLPFDAPPNVAALLERDDALRGYAKGLEAAVDCYRAQTAPMENR